MGRRLTIAVAVLIGTSVLPAAAHAAEGVSLAFEQQPSWVLFRIAMTGTSGTLTVKVSEPSGAYMYAGFYDDQLRWAGSSVGIEGYSGTRASVQGDDLFLDVVRKDYSFEIRTLLSSEDLDGDTQYVLIGASGDFATWSASLEVDGEILLLDRIAQGAGAHYLTYHDLSSPTSVSASYRGPGAMAILNGTWSTQLEGVAVGSMQFYWSEWSAAAEFTHVIHEQASAVESYDCPCWFRELRGSDTVTEGTLRIDATRVAVIGPNSWEWTAAAFFDVVLPEDFLASFQ